jgi:membrane protein DedA with SNARE-associated domain
MIRHLPPFIQAHLIAVHQFPLAAIISLDVLRNALNTLGYPAVALFVMIESSGIPFPGETMLLFASFYAAVDQKLQLPLVIACAALGAIVGDNIGYTVGRTGGHAFLTRFGRYLFLKPEHLERAERFFLKHGDKTVFFGRFIAVLRAWAAFLAGINRMRWSSFLIYNAAGGIIWATIYGCLGFFAGRVFHDNFAAVENIAKTISWTGAVLIIAIVIIAYIVFRVRQKQKKQVLTDITPETEEAPETAISTETRQETGAQKQVLESTEAQQPETISSSEIC